MSTITLYGISNCDTVKKARRWLDQRQLTYSFHDFRKDGLTPALVKTWLNQHDMETVLNKRGRTWRDLSDTEKQVNTTAQVITLCCKYPALIKRPVLVSGKHILIGFDTKQYADLFSI